MISGATLWTIIVAMGVGSYMLRFTFIGLVGDRPLPPWLLRHLRYTAVAILPALVAPGIIWSDPSGAGMDPMRTLAAAAAIAIGLWTRSANWAFLGGLVALVVLVNWPF